MTAPAWATRRPVAEQRAVASALSYRLLHHALTVRVHLSLGQPDDVHRARRQLQHAQHALAELRAALAPELHDPLDAPAPAVPAT